MPQVFSTCFGGMKTDLALPHRRARPVCRRQRASSLHTGRVHGRLGHLHDQPPPAALPAKPPVLAPPLMSEAHLRRLPRRSKPCAKITRVTSLVGRQGVSSQGRRAHHAASSWSPADVSVLKTRARDSTARCIPLGSTSSDDVRASGRTASGSPLPRQAHRSPRHDPRWPKPTCAPPSPRKESRCRPLPRRLSAAAPAPAVRHGFDVRQRRTRHGQRASTPVPCGKDRYPGQALPLLHGRLRLPRSAPQRGTERRGGLGRSFPDHCQNAGGANADAAPPLLSPSLPLGGA